MPIVDKYRPIDPTPATLTPIGRVLAPLWAIAVLAALWSAPSLSTWVVEHEGLPAHGVFLETTGRLDEISRASGLAAARHWLADAAVPLKGSARILRAPPPLEVSEPVIAEAPPEPGVAPGQRWVGPSEPGAHRVRRALVVGASSIQYYLGTELERRLELYDGVEVRRLGKLGTGLARPEVFDWQTELVALLDEFRPDVVVCQFGGNDAQPIELPGGRKVWYGHDDWAPEYQTRLRALVGRIQASGATAVFVGMPVMRDPGFSDRMRRLNDITEEAVVPLGARFVPSADLTSAPDGAYRTEVAFGGRRGLMRMSDGIHYSRLGARFVSDRLVHRLEAEVPLVPADAALAPATGFTLVSEARGETTRYLAFVPRHVPDEGLPALILLHGAEGSWRDWSDHAHEALQRLAEQSRLVLVTPDGRPFGWYVDSPVVPDADLHRYLVEELVPDLRERLPLSGPIGVTGLSMGGHGALGLALLEPGLVRSVSSMSGVTDLTRAASRTQLQALLGTYEAEPARWEAWSAQHLARAHPERLRGLPMLLSCGRSDPWFAANERFHASLEELGVEHLWDPGDGGHTWEYWVDRLPKHVAFHAQALGRIPVEVRLQGGQRQ